MKRVLCFLFLIVISVIIEISFSNTAHAEIQNNIPSTSAKGMILIEKTTGRVLAEKNADEQLSIASTTKIGRQQ